MDYTMKIINSDGSEVRVLDTAVEHYGLMSDWSWRTERSWDPGFVEAVSTQTAEYMQHLTSPYSKGNDARRF